MNLDELTPLERVQYKVQLENVELWTREEACLYLDVSLSQLRNLAYYGKIEPVKGVSKESRYRRRDIHAMAGIEAA